MRIVIVGGGVIGTALAVTAADRGHEVVQLERDHAPRAASVRNFGLVWICGRQPGRELELALAGRARWEELARRAPDVGFRPCGCLVVARDAAELAVLEAACARPGAAARGFRVLPPDAARALEPALGGDLVGALHSPLDAVVEPHAVLPALRALAAASGRYRFLAGRAVVAASAAAVRDHEGARHEGDIVVLACGAARELGDPADLDTGALALVRLQMLELEPAAPAPRMALAGGDSLRYYPAFDVPERGALPPQDPVAARYGAQLLVAPRASGRLTVGDTHSDDEPGAVGVDDEPAAWFLESLAGWLGRPPGRVRRRWAGRYLKRVERDPPYLRATRADGVVVLTAVGGNGMTGALQIAAETADDLGL